jgi:hypothetical protein
MTWYTGTCGIMAMGLLCKLTLWSVCVCVGGGGRVGFNGFVIKTQSFPMHGHYWMDVISSVGHDVGLGRATSVTYSSCA